MQHNASKYLLDALHACEAIVEFTQGITLKDYSADLKLRSAVERQFETVGEALYRLDHIVPEYREHFPVIGNQ